MSGAPPIRVLVVEDSPTVRQLLVTMLESDPEIRVVGEADNGLEAVRQAVRLAPDLITMDVNMPQLDGLAATKQIMAEAPTPIIIVSSTVNQRSVALSLDATQAGALMVLPKPESPLAPHFAEQQRQLVQMAKAMARVKVVRRWGGRGGSQLRSWLPSSDGAPRASIGSGAVQLVTIGCSTGGPAALREILVRLPDDFPVPIAVVQHMAAGFVTGLARWLDGDCPLRVKVAEDGELLAGGTVYIAGDGRHLGIARDGGWHRARARAVELPPIGGFRPSASFLFASAAQALGAAAVGVVLTGMGSDGVDGLRELHAAGAPTLAQDEGSSVVFGMAREAIAAGVVREVLPLDGLAPRLRELVR